MARILIIDDAANLRLLYRLELEAEGHEIVDAGSGAEALEVLTREKIDAVVLDLLLPDRFGLQLLDEILLQYRHLPLVINTAYEQFRDNFQTWGAEAFIVKSSDLSELKSTLQQVISNHTPNGASERSRENALQPQPDRRKAYKKSSPSLPTALAQKNYDRTGALV